MRRARSQPSFEERIAGDPTLAAEVAAIRFEADEGDRFDRGRSFVCRHIGLLYGLGFLMAFGPIFAILTLASSIDFGSTSGTSLLLKLTYVTFAGFLLILFCAARPGSKNWATALAKVLGMAAILLAIAIPLIGGFDTALHSLTR